MFKKIKIGVLRRDTEGINKTQIGNFRGKKRGQWLEEK